MQGLHNQAEIQNYYVQFIITLIYPSVVYIQIETEITGISKVFFHV